MDDVFVMVIIIVVVGCATGVLTDYLKTRRREAERGQPAADVAAELDALRQRVAVLEEIVTDEKYHLQREIDRLERQA